MRLNTGLALVVALASFFASPTNAGSLPAPTNLINDEIKIAGIKQINVLRCMHGASTSQFVNYSCCGESQIAQKIANQRSLGANPGDPTFQLHFDTSSNGTPGCSTDIPSVNSALTGNSLSSSIETQYQLGLDCWDFANAKKNTEKTCDNVNPRHMTAYIWDDITSISFGAQTDSSVNKNGDFFSVTMLGGNDPNGSTTGSASLGLHILAPSKTKDECTATVDTWASTQKFTFGCQPPTSDAPVDPGSPYTATQLVHIHVKWEMSPSHTGTGRTSMTSDKRYFVNNADPDYNCPDGILNVDQYTYEYEVIVPKTNPCADSYKWMNDYNLVKYYDNGEYEETDVLESCAKKESLCSYSDCNGFQCQRGSRCVSSMDCYNSQCDQSNPQKWVCAGYHHFNIISSLVIMMIMTLLSYL